MTFIQTALYGGNVNVAYIKTKTSIYNNQKTKSSMMLPLDPDSVNRIILRAHYQCYYWIHCFQETEVKKERQQMIMREMGRRQKI